MQPPIWLYRNGAGSFPYIRLIKDGKEENERRCSLEGREEKSFCPGEHVAERGCPAILEGDLHLSGRGGVLDLSVHTSAEVVEAEVLVPTTDTNLELHLLPPLPDELPDSAFPDSAGGAQPPTPDTSIYAPPLLLL